MHNSLINAPGISLWTLVCKLPFAAIIADYLAEKRNFAGSFEDVQTKTLFQLRLVVFVEPQQTETQRTD